MTRHVTCDGTFSRAFLARRQCTSSRGANMTRAPRRNSASQKRRAVCAVCGMEKSEYKKFRSTWVDQPMQVALRPDPSHYRIRTINRRQREGAFQRVVTVDDVICRVCHNRHSSNAGIPRRTRSEHVAEQAGWDARRLDLLLEFMDKNCDGHLPHWTVTYTLPGWNGPREEAAIIHARQWIGNLICGCRLPGSPTRLEAVAALGQKEAALVADLLTREKPDEQAVWDASRIALLLEFMDKDCDGQLPKWYVKYTLPGWNGPGLIHARQWIRALIRCCRLPGSPTRLEAVAALGHEEAALVADLLTREKQYHGNCDVEGDSRRVRILAKYVREELDGQLPRDKDVAALAGWAHEDAVVAQVKVAIWWRNFSRHNGGERKKRVEESAPDEATKKALQYLAQCKVRDKENARRDVEGDSRRVRILAKYVREKCGGQLPRQKDRAELAGWEREGAGVAQVQIGQWWRTFSINNGGERKQRVEESAPDEETQDALQYLAQCPMREIKRFKRQRN